VPARLAEPLGVTVPAVEDAVVEPELEQAARRRAATAAAAVTLKSSPC